LGFTPQDFIDGKGSSVKRNPLLAQLMYYGKDIESFGTGIRRISNECSAANIKVAFEIRKLGFAVVFYRPVNHINADDSIIVNIPDSITENVGVEFGEVREKFGEKFGDKFGDNVEKFGDNVEKFGDNVEKFGENKTQSIILEIMRKYPAVSAKAIADEIGLSARGVEKSIRELKNAGLLERVGSAKGGHWVVKLPNMPE
jgi:ATP-dependent DNA helicase RecG